MKIGNKKELKSIAEEKSGNLDYKDFLKIYNYGIREPVFYDNRCETYCYYTI